MASDASRRPKRTRVGVQADHAGMPLLALPPDGELAAATPAAAVYDHNAQDGTHEEGVYHSMKSRARVGDSEETDGGVHLVAAAVPFSADRFFNSSWLPGESNTRQGFDSFGDGSPSSLALGRLTTAHWRHKDTPSMGKSTPVSRRCVGWMAAAALLALVIALVALSLIGVTRDISRSNSNRGNKSGSTAASSKSLVLRVGELKVMVAQLQAASAASTTSDSDLLRISQLEAVVAQLQAELNNTAEAMTHLLTAGATRHTLVGNMTAALQTPSEAPTMLTDVAAACKARWGNDAFERSFLQVTAGEGRITCKTVGVIASLSPALRAQPEGTRLSHEYGFSVAGSVDGLVVVGSQSRSVYVYRIDMMATDTLPQLLTTINAPYDLPLTVKFGTSVAASGRDVVVVGAYSYAGSGHRGYTYVYRVNVTDVTPARLMARLESYGSHNISDQFGYAVAAGSGGVLVVGAYCDFDKGKDAGAAYIFHVDTSSDTTMDAPVQLLAKLVADDGAESHYFGFTVAVGSDGLIVIGAKGYGFTPGSSGSYSGAAYVYSVKLGGAAPRLLAKLIPADVSSVAPCFGGKSLAAGDNGLVVVGSCDVDQQRGLAYLYRVNTASNSTQLVAKLSAHGEQSTKDFGRTVAAGNDGLVLVGAPGDPFYNRKHGGLGCMYVYRTRQATATDMSSIRLLAKFVPVNSTTDDRFGYVAAVTADGLVVIGAPETAPAHSGSVYIYPPQ